MNPGLATPPRSVRSSVGCWLVAVACGVLESVVNALTSPDYDATVQLSIRAAVYVPVTILILRLRRGGKWTRLALTAVLGVFGLFSLLVEPVSWLLSGGAPLAFLAAADAPTLTVTALRVAHVLAVVGALALMFSPSANRFFR